MKKSLLSLIAFAFLAVGSTFAQSDNGLIGRARGAAHDCLHNYSVTDWNHFSGISTSETCPDGNLLKQVIFYVRPILPPCIPSEEICPTPHPIVIAVVSFDCDGNIISTSCF